MSSDMRTGGRPVAAPSGTGVEVVGAAGRRISWGAIFAGLCITLAVQLLLGMLGIGIGFSMVSPGEGNTPDASSFGLGAAIWWGVSYLIALFVGGYVAARLAGRLTSWDGALHGLLTWAFALLVTFYLVGTAVGSAIGGAFNVVGSTLSAAGQGIKNAVPQVAQVAGVSPDQIQQTARNLLNAQPTGGDPRSLSPEQAQQEIAANLPKLALGGDQARQARERIVAIMAAQLNISPQEANARLDQLQGNVQQTAQQMTDTARQAADKAASGVARASFVAFIGLVLGACAAAWGGHVGARRQPPEPA
jgi:hypothetical protein